MAEKKARKGLCGICPSGCGVEIAMEGEQLRQIKPMEGHPLGIVCTRGVHAEEVVYSPDRIPFPVKRIGNRGEGKWERISWEEAFEISARLIQNIVEKYGPEAMAIYSGRGGFEQSSPRSVHNRGAGYHLFKLPFSIGVSKHLQL